MSAVQVGTDIPLRYNQPVSHRLSILGEPSAEMAGWTPRSERSRPPAGYSWFNPTGADPAQNVMAPAPAGLVAFCDVWATPGLVRIAFMAVRPDHRGEGLARTLAQAVYDTWPDAKVHWGKLMQEATGHLYGWFQQHYPDRTIGGSRYYTLATASGHLPGGVSATAAQPGVFYHATGYRSWPLIKQHGLRPLAEGGVVWLFPELEPALRFSESYDSAHGVPSAVGGGCVVVLRDPPGVHPYEGGIPGAWVSDAPVGPEHVYDIIRPQDRAHYAKTADMEHRPSEGPPAHDLLGEDAEGEQIAPPDIYEHPERYTFGFREMLPETARTLRDCRGRPDAQISVHRAQPPGMGLRTGDWVSLSKAYAEYDLRSEPTLDRVVETYRVPARDVRWAGDDLMEWGYFGSPIRGRTARVASMLDLYHRTTPEAARAISERGFQQGLENTGDLYFSTFRGDEPNAQGAGYGEGVVHVRVPASMAELDDEFPSGERHYRVAWRDLRPEHYVKAKQAARKEHSPMCPSPEHRTAAWRRTADADTAGVMICLKPPQKAVDAISSLPDFSEDPDDMHLTLAYLGSVEEAGGEMGRERVYRACYDFALHSGHLGLTGRVNGFGAFLNDGESAVVALWDMPGVGAFRADLVAYLGDHGVYVNSEHDFIPHTTLNYSEDPAVPTDLPDDNPQAVHFTSVWIAWGDEEWQEVALTGLGLPRASGLVEGWPMAIARSRA